MPLPQEVNGILQEGTKPLLCLPQTQQHPKKKTGTGDLPLQGSANLPPLAPLPRSFIILNFYLPAQGSSLHPQHRTQQEGNLAQGLSGGFQANLLF